MNCLSTSERRKHQTIIAAISRSYPEGLSPQELPLKLIALNKLYTYLTGDGYAYLVSDAAYRTAAVQQAVEMREVLSETDIYSHFDRALVDESRRIIGRFLSIIENRRARKNE
jgi:hypothetical protein